MKVFQVIKPGMFTTIQDRGRYGYLRYGVPVSGAMDQFSLRAANCNGSTMIDKLVLARQHRESWPQ